MESERKRNVRAAGAEARRNGWGFENNPFPSHDRMFEVWLEGWGAEDEAPPEEKPKRPDWALRIILGLALLTMIALFAILVQLEAQS